MCRNLKKDISFTHHLSTGPSLELFDSINYIAKYENYNQATKNKEIFKRKKELKANCDNLLKTNEEERIRRHT